MAVNSNLAYWKPNLPQASPPSTPLAPVAVVIVDPAHRGMALNAPRLLPTAPLDPRTVIRIHGLMAPHVFQTSPMSLTPR